MSARLEARPTPAGAARPESGNVRVWLADLDLDAAAVDRRWTLLAPDERARAARFHFRRDAARWIVARATLRAVLGRCLDADPARLGFTHGPQGKPALARVSGEGPLEFNVSHSANLAVYAVARGTVVGIDVERLRAIESLDAIAARTFSAREYTALRGLPPETRPVGFFNCWTRKEAYIKARGAGLSYPLDRFSVSLAPDAPARLEEVADAPSHPLTWAMIALPVPAGFVGALVVGGRPDRVECGRWTEPDR
jgi:4'-phosphopantetheinyl transferase